MKIASTFSVIKDTSRAVEQVCGNLMAKLDGVPDYILAFYTEAHDSGRLAQELSVAFAGTQVQGCSSCQFVMTEEGVHGEEGWALGLWGVCDPDGAFGVGMSALDEDPEQAVLSALEQAMLNSGRSGETPAMVWLTATPGREERIIAGIEKMLGDNVPVFGGSAADSTVNGNWSVVCNAKTVANGVAVAVFYPSGGVTGFFHNGYSPTERGGIITRAEGRSILEIDGRPAAQVYDEWTDGLLGSIAETGGNVLMRTTFSPLGREVGQVGEVIYYNLSHPASVTSGGGLSLFTDIDEGDHLVCMSGARESLISRAGRVAKSALNMREDPTLEGRGALIIFCAGCMLAVGEGMEHVVGSLREALGEVPFIGGFTFGEQGCFSNGRNGHGNLMISVVNFYS